MAERFKFRYVTQLIGIFVVLVVILAVISIFVAAQSQRWHNTGKKISRWALQNDKRRIAQKSTN